MSRIDARLQALPRSGITEQHLFALGRISPEKLRPYLQEWRRFTPKGLDTLEALTETAAPNRAAMRFDQKGHWYTGIEQQSAVAWISKKIGLVIGSDESSALWQVKPPRAIGDELDKTKLRDDDGDLDGVEGLHYDTSREVLRAMLEEKSKIKEMRFKEEDGELELSNPKTVDKVKKVGKRGNKLYEGMSRLPAELSPDGNEYYVAVNEGDPCKVVFIDPETLKVKGTADLPASVREAFPDLSDVEVSPRGTLLLLSDEGRKFGEFALKKTVRGVGPGKPVITWTLVPLAIHDIVMKGIDIGKAERLQPEGICVDADGDLWICCEANSVLIRFAQVD